MAFSRRPAGGAPRQSDELEAETRRMEARLRSLREQRERLEATIAQAAPPSQRWSAASGPLVRGARAVMGATTTTASAAAPEAGRQFSQPSYDSFDSRRGVPAGGPRPSSNQSGDYDLPIETRRVTKENQASDTATTGLRLRPEHAPSWGIQHTQQWLATIGLERYAPVFAKHEVNGSVLLDLATADLDYLGVLVLGHRKTLMKGVEELRATCGYRPGAPGGDRPRSALPAKDSAAAAVSSERRDKETKASTAAHWSTLPPLHQNAGGAAGAGAASNSTSLLDAPLDEEAEHQAFREAVMAWRKGRVPISSTAASSGAEASAGSTRATHETLSASAMWTNPATVAQQSSTSNLLEGTIDEEAESRKFREAVDAWRRKDSAPKKSTEAVDSQTAITHIVSDEKAICYNCFMSFAVGTGFKPQDEDIKFGIASLGDKAFCSQKCYEAVHATFDALRAARIAAAEALEASMRNVPLPSTTMLSPPTSPINVPGEEENLPIAATIMFADDLLMDSAKEAGAKMATRMQQAADAEVQAVAQVEAPKAASLSTPKQSTAVDIWQVDMNRFI